MLSWFSCHSFPTWQAARRGHPFSLAHCITRVRFQSNPRLHSKHKEAPLNRFYITSFRRGLLWTTPCPQARISILMRHPVYQSLSCWFKACAFALESSTAVFHKHADSHLLKCLPRLQEASPLGSQEPSVSIYGATTKAGASAVASIRQTTLDAQRSPLVQTSPFTILFGGGP